MLQAEFLPWICCGIVAAKLLSHFQTQPTTEINKQKPSHAAEMWGHVTSTHGPGRSSSPSVPLPTSFSLYHHYNSIQRIHMNPKLHRAGAWWQPDFLREALLTSWFYCSHCELPTRSKTRPGWGRRMRWGWGTRGAPTAEEKRSQCQWDPIWSQLLRLSGVNRHFQEWISHLCSLGDTTLLPSSGHRGHLCRFILRRAGRALLQLPGKREHFWIWI